MMTSLNNLEPSKKEQGLFSKEKPRSQEDDGSKAGLLGQAGAKAEATETEKSDLFGQDELLDDNEEDDSEKRRERR